MRVSQNLLSHRFRSLLSTPNLRPTQEKSLFRCEAIDVCRTRFPLHRFLKRQPGDLQSAEITDAFSRHQFAILVQANLIRLKTGKLLLNASGAIGIVFRVSFRPPVFEVALQIKLTTLIVEAV